MSEQAPLPENWTGLPQGLRDAVLKKLIARRRKVSAAQTVYLTKADHSGLLPAALEQEIFLRQQKRFSGHLAWTMAMRPIVLDEVDEQKVWDAFEALAKRHDVLRTTFHRNGARYVLQINNDRPVPFEATKIPITAAVAGVEEWIRRRYQAMLKQPFDPETGPLWRAELLHRGGRGVILLTFCSAIIDGESVYLIDRDLRAVLAGEALATPEFNYADYAATQAELVRSGRFDQALSWWQDRLAGGPPASWADGREEIAPSRLYEQTLGSATGQALDAYTAAKGTTPSIILLTEFMRVLRDLDGNDDLWVSSALATRDISGTENMAGTFARQALLRFTWPSDGDPLAHIQETLTDTLDQQPVPHLLVREMLEQTHPHGPSAYRYVFNHRLVGSPEEAVAEDTPFRPGPKEVTDAREEDILFMTLQSGAQRELHWYLREDRFDRKSAENLLKRFHAALLLRLSIPEKVRG